MIRINLSGAPRPKKGKRGGAAAVSVPAMPGEGPNILLLLLVGILAGGGACYYLFYSANTKAAELERKITAENAESTRLADIETRFDQRQKEKDAFEKRVKVIDQLRADQSGPLNLLNVIGDTVNNTDAVWLTAMSETGNSVNIDGTALTTHAVANLMTNLKNSGYFKTVEIKLAAQDTTNKEIQAFTFTLVCEKMPKS